MVDRVDALDVFYYAAQAVTQHAFTPLDAGQVVVKRALDPFLAAVIHIGKTEHVASNGSGWIKTAVLPQ